MEPVLFGYENEDAVRSHWSGEWEVPQGEIDRFDILFALVDYPSYEGYAYYLLLERSTGKLHDVQGSHCSCMGFEGQFDPSETVPSAFEKYEFLYIEDHNIDEVKAAVLKIAAELKKAN